MEEEKEDDEEEEIIIIVRSKILPCVLFQHEFPSGTRRVRVCRIPC